ncbi:hypothetical protein AgCh_017658 [Apium graveolens]
MASEFTGFMKDMSSHLTTIAKIMNATQERETKVVEKKKRLLTEIASLPGITQAEAIRAASELEERMDTISAKSSEMPYEKAELLNVIVCRVDAVEAELIATKKDSGPEGELR